MSLVFILFGRGRGKMYDGLNLISLRELEDRRRCRNCMIIDLRDEMAFRAGHFPDAVNLPFEAFDRWAYGLPKRKTIILYCERGGSAMLAGRRLMRAGYEVEIVSGGYRGMCRENNQ